MRDIRFRAWLKDSAIKKMNDSFIHSLVRMLDVQLIDFERRHVGFIRENGTFFFSFDDVELLEFTGMKDKNGMEIFEGDIFRHFNGTLCKITFKEASFGLTGAQVNQYLCFANSHGEVVGNIFQNPDLLK